VLSSEDVTAFYDLERQYFTFDSTLDADTSQEGIYEEVVRPSVDDIFKGINATVMVGAPRIERQNCLMSCRIRRTDKLGLGKGGVASAPCTYD